MYTVDFTVGTDTDVEIKATEEGKVLLSIDGEAFAFSADDAKRFAHNFMTIANAAAMLASQTFVPTHVINGPDREIPVCERDGVLYTREEMECAIKSLAKQDQAGETDDSYARTKDARDTIERWHKSAASAGDLELCEIIDALGLERAAEIYAAAREVTG